MRKSRSLTHRIKLILIYCITIIFIVAIITVTLTLTASRQAMEDKKAHLSLLTEQVLMNFSAAATAAAQQLLSSAASKGVITQMYSIRNLSEEASGYYQDVQGLIYAVNQMITTQSYYDSLYIRMDNGLSFSNAFTEQSFITAASALMDAEKYGQNTYGRILWARDADGEMYLIRDLYNLSPIQHVGKVVARIRQNMLADLGTNNDSLDSIIVFLDENGRTIAMVGSMDEAMTTEAERIYKRGAEESYMDQPYAVAMHQDGDWSAVGFLPTATLNSVKQAVIRTGIIVGLLGVLFGTLAVMGVTQRMTRQMRLLVKSMDEVADGNMNLTVPIETHDEFGLMSAHFNRMIGETRELLARVVQEENRKSKAEYEMLEYKYRSLQSQINPHFIYNAMETVNALAKIDGNDEICDVVKYISAFFRQNAHNMEKKFVTVHREFDSLQQYAHIYHHIHGSTLSTPFIYTPEVADALIPTMILQPVLENALVHGVCNTEDDALVTVSAKKTGEDQLVVTVQDNGSGMPEETVEQILNGPANEPMNGTRYTAGIGLRNVRDRLRLIYNDRAKLVIESRKDAGTLVSISIPLVYDEEELGYNPDY
ncbi:MAG: histidine kinase [Bacillota bacterium]